MTSASDLETLDPSAARRQRADDDAGLGQRPETVDADAFVSDAGVERFDVAVAPRLSGPSALGTAMAVEVPRRLRRRRCGTRRPSSRHSRWIFLVIDHPAPAGLPVGEEFRQDVEPTPRRGSQCADPLSVDRQKRTTHPAVHRARRWRPPSDPPPTTPIPHLVYRQPDP